MSRQVFAQSYEGPYDVTVSPFKTILVDLAPGARKGLRAEREGMNDVSNELTATTPAVRAAAGVSPDVFDHFVQCTSNIAQIRATRVIVDKLSEVLVESEAKYAHERENDVSIIAEVAKTMARLKGDPSLAAAFEKTIAYVSQPGVKAVKTRKRNKEAKQRASKKSTEPG